MHSNMSCLYAPQTLLESMVDTAESLCPHVIKRSNLRSELLKASANKIVVPKSFVAKTLLEQSGVDIINKIRCVLDPWRHWRHYIETSLIKVFICPSVRWSWVWHPFCPIASLTRFWRLCPLHNKLWWDFSLISIIFNIFVWVVNINSLYEL